SSRSFESPRCRRTRLELRETPRRTQSNRAWPCVVSEIWDHERLRSERRPPPPVIGHQPLLLSHTLRGHLLASSFDGSPRSFSAGSRDSGASRDPAARKILPCTVPYGAPMR